MRRLILAAGLGLVMGTFGGFALGIFVYPFWFLNDVAMERLDANEGRFVLAQGTFIHPDPDDPVHWGRPRRRCLPPPLIPRVVSAQMMMAGSR